MKLEVWFYFPMMPTCNRIFISLCSTSLFSNYQSFLLNRGRFAAFSHLDGWRISYAANAIPWEQSGCGAHTVWICWSTRGRGCHSTLMIIRLRPVRLLLCLPSRSYKSFLTPTMMFDITFLYLLLYFILWIHSFPCKVKMLYEVIVFLTFMFCLYSYFCTSIFFLFASVYVKD